MALEFYVKVFKKAVKDSEFRHNLRHEVWDMVRQKLPGRLVTPRSNYIHCRESNPKVPQGRWLPPQSLGWRPAAYGLLFNETDEVLMVWDISMGAYWHFPGGGMNRGETQQQTIAREFVEETGLVVEVGPVIDVWDDFFIMPTGRATHGVLCFYLVKVVGGELKADGNGFDTGEAKYFHTHPNLVLSPHKVHPQTSKMQALIERARTLRHSLSFDSGTLK